MHQFEKKQETFSTKLVENKDPHFVFRNKKSWLIRVKKDGIEFNRKEFPEMTAEDFAREFVEILEKNWPDFFKSARN